MLTRNQKTFFKNEFYIMLVGFLFGLWIWLSLFRVVHIMDEEKSVYLFLSLAEPEKGDEVVFSYPSLNSPLRVSKVLDGEEDALNIRIDEETVEPLNEDLTVGVILFKF